MESLHSALTTLSQLLLLHSFSSNDDKFPNQTVDQQQLWLDNLLKQDNKASLLRQTSEISQDLNPKNVSPPLGSRTQSSESKSVAESSPSADGIKVEQSDFFTDIHIDCVLIEDCPDVPNRALMLDAAPLARIPSLSTMLQIVDSLLSIKINQLHLMMSLQQVSYDNNQSNQVNDKLGHVCPIPYNTNEIVKLSQYCKVRGISLVPAFDLDPSSSSGNITDITNVVSETLSFFPDVTTVSIGPALTSVLVCGASNPYSPNPWRGLGVKENATLILCANVFLDAAHLYKCIPMNAVLMEYGFQANYSFNSKKACVSRHGRSTANCPGTAAWSSLAGFPEAGVSNVFKGCVGKQIAGNSLSSSLSHVVIAHWSTPASLTPLVFMWPAVVVGAGLSWNKQTHYDYVNSSLGVLIDTYLVKVPESGFGNALVELGRCESWLTREMREQDNSDLTNLPPITTGPGSTLHQLLVDPDSVLLEHLKPEKFGSILRHIKRSIRAIANNRVVKSTWPLMPVAAAEINLTADLMMTSARIGRALVTVGSNPRSNLGMAVVNPGLGNLPPTLRTDVANRLLSLRESYSCLWLHCHQPAGLQASLLLLSSLLTRLLPQHDNIHEL